MYHVDVGTITLWRTKRRIGKRLKDVPFSFPAVLFYVLLSCGFRAEWEK